MFLCNSSLLFFQSFCFPVACGHRRCCFTGRSSKPLRGILLSVDDKIPTQQQIEEFTEDSLRYLNDVKSTFEKITEKIFHYIFSGSVVERFGIPLLISMPRGCCGRLPCKIGALDTDLDIMFFTLEDKASFTGEENILVEPFIDESDGFTGYAKLTHLTADIEGELISSKRVEVVTRSAVENTRVLNFPGHTRYFGMCEDTPRVRLKYKGPSMKLRIGAFFETDITLCIQCPEWPTMSDWASRPRYWPSFDDAHRIMSLGCHLVAKPAPSDNDKTSWRFSFSLAEVELSKLVPDTARKCFLALKIIFKDHLQPVVPKMASYHMKTIFFNTLEKVPLGFWIDNNMEECFRTLLAELRDALLSAECPHHWFSYINLFKREESRIKPKRLHLLAKKVQRILNDPAPFIFDDGCCCLSPCCFRAPYNNFTRRSSDQFLAAYDEVVVTVDGHVTSGSQDAVDPGNYHHQLPVSPSLISEAQLNPSSSSSGNRDQVTTTGHNKHVVSLPTNNAGEPSFSPEDNAFEDRLPILVSSPLPQNNVA